MFLMLNPSAPNASCDDPTIRRCRSRTSQGRKRQHATLSGQIILWKAAIQRLSVARDPSRPIDMPATKCGRQFPLNL
ncbi:MULTISPECIES: DUF1643 domain-containing protein [Paraburkholderia]|uniref:DUF1643 domain-containing protein n=1 Tax=Paraburkholderia podalyriae TaxID=1938811 RepID=A0ABR7Q2G1_9BURK|nr:DUF1643 domain-containing protein [Paraburkholderia podalyriae]